MFNSNKDRVFKKQTKWKKKKKQSEIDDSGIRFVCDIVDIVPNLFLLSLIIGKENDITNLYDDAQVAFNWSCHVLEFPKAKTNLFEIKTKKLFKFS